MELLPGAEPFRLDAGPRRLLLLHGFGSTPFELRYLAEKLQEDGYGSVCPLLPGHGTTLAHFARSRAAEWLATARQALTRLAREAPDGQVAVIGQSLGALLGLQLAAELPAAIAALVCLATPLEFTPLSAAAVRAYRYTPLRLLELTVPRPGGADIAEPRLRRGLPGYDQVPLAAATQLFRLQQQTLRALPRVRCPLLALHGGQDHSAPFSGVERLLREVGSPTKRVEVLADSFHVVSLDVDKNRVAALIRDFLGDHHPLGAT